MKTGTIQLRVIVVAVYAITNSKHKLSLVEQPLVNDLFSESFANVTIVCGGVSFGIMYPLYHCMKALLPFLLLAQMPLYLP